MRALVVALLCACTTTPDDRLRASLPEDGEHGPTHRPGQPCLLCHDFALAGTVYRFADDPPRPGVANVEVTVTDAGGRAFTARTNSAGTFYVTIGNPDEPPRQEGRVVIAAAPEFPLRVAVAFGDQEQEMRNVIHREGSCGRCHTAEPGAASAGRVFLEEEQR